MVKRVLIVGGGSAGWIVAAFMDAAINGAGAKRVEISLIESERIGRIGVGEATIPTIKRTLSTIGVSEKDFMRATSATFKHGIDFRDWLEIGHSYFHPFDRYNPGGQFDHRGVSWMMSDKSVPFAETVSVQPRLAKSGLAPKQYGSRDYDSSFSYAYHMDAESLAETLADISVSRGVRRLFGTVAEVARDERGWVQSITTESGQTLAADVYIDCSGFARVLQSERQRREYVDFSPWLLNDRAVALRIPRDNFKDKSRLPYTIATAMSAGWRWEISLQDRKGIGYVYSSSFMDDDSAEAELRAVLGDSVDGVEARKLRFNTGYTPCPWDGNCVAIGLSAGFLEPLESTGIYLIEYAAAKLCEYFPFAGGQEILSQCFNRFMSERHLELVDFIAAHYCLSKRDDSEYWREVRSKDRVPPGLSQTMSLWQNKPPTESDFSNTQQLFSYHNYECIFLGMEWAPDVVKQSRSATRATLIPEAITRAEKNFMRVLPKQEDWLTELREQSGRIS